MFTVAGRRLKFSLGPTIRVGLLKLRGGLEMHVLKKTPATGATISLLLPSLAAAHPGHADLSLVHGLGHGWEYVLLTALAVVITVRALRRR